MSLSTPKLISPPPAILGATDPVNSAPGTIRGGAYNLDYFPPFCGRRPIHRARWHRKLSIHGLFANGPKDFALSVGRNVCHGSDEVPNAEKEIALWFKPEELTSWDLSQKDWVNE